MGESYGTLLRKTPSWLLFKDLAKIFVNSFPAFWIFKEPISTEHNHSLLHTGTLEILMKIFLKTYKNFI